MTNGTRIRWSLFLGVSFLLASAAQAHAYIDAGSGSYIFQLLVGTLVGAAVALKVFWRRIFDLLGSLFSRKR